MVKWIVEGFVLVLLFAGCTQTRITEPKRTAVEQLLISTAADRAWEQIDFAQFNGRRVFVDPAYITYLEGEDKGYVLGTLRDVLSKNGALLVTEITNAHVIVEPRSGALSIDSNQSIIGVPKIPLPTVVGIFESPEVSVFKSEKQFSIAKLALLAYEQDSRRHFHSSGPLVGRAHHKYYKFLGYFRYTSSSIPEKKKQKKGEKTSP